MTSEEKKKLLNRLEAMSFRSTREELIFRKIFTEEQARKVETYYKFHLFLMAQNPHASNFHVPSDQVGEFWQAHILQTKTYRLDCERICGQLLHHDYFPKPGSPVYKESSGVWRYEIRKLAGSIPRWFTYTGKGIYPKQAR